MRSEEWCGKPQFQNFKFQIVGTHRVRPRTMNNNCGVLVTDNLKFRNLETCAQRNQKLET